MIITICGAQGQGKSTVLQRLEALNYNVIPNKTARTMLSNWGMTLEEVYSNRLLACRFHDLIIDHHEQLCKPHYHTDEIVFIERSYADIFSYALSVLGPFNTYSEWLNEFYQKCSDLQSNFSAAIYLSGRDYTPEADGVRSINKHFSRNVDTLISKYLTEFSNNSGSHRVFNISSVDVDSRINNIEKIIEEYFEDNLE